MSEHLLDLKEPQKLGVRVREAREARGWTQLQMAERLGMARTTVVAIEKGERRLKPHELFEIASCLGRSVSELLQRTTPVEGLVVQLREALPASLAGVEILPGIEELQCFCEDYVRIEEICRAPLRRRYPTEYDIGGTDPVFAAEDVATAERSRLGLGEGPLLNLRDILEADAGLRIFQLVLPFRVEGMYVLTQSAGGCIAVNLGHSLERRRESLAHEYGHFLTARYRAEVTLEDRYERRPAGERFAEAFARAFLLPAAGLRRRFLELERERSQGATLGDLLRLAHLYAVSMQAVTGRLEELRLLPAGTWARLARRSFQVPAVPQLLKLDPVHPEDEPFSSRYVALAIEAWQQAELSESELARILRTDRLGARDRVQRFQPDAADADHGNESIDLGASLLRAVGH
jgi:Zn-dependent peptidase ImmA (M78 family)/transcriptional regulator with XRE-family HTH domain